MLFFSAFSSASLRLCGCISYLSFNPCAAAFEDVVQLFQIDLAGVAAGGLEEGAVGGAEIDAFLRIPAGEESIGESAGEAVPAADAVFDFQAVESAAFVELAVDIQNGRPVVDQAALDLAERRADDFHVRISLHHFLDHALVSR